MKYRKFRNGKSPVIILGDGLTSLGALRCFGRSGIPAYSILHNPGVMSWSRWFRRMSTKRKDISHPDQLSSFLNELPLDRCVLVPCADNWVRAVANLPHELANRYFQSQSSAETLELLIDKGRFARLLESLGVPHPRTVLLQSSDEIESLEGTDFEDSFLKPRNSQSFFTKYETKAFRVNSRTNAAALFERARGDGHDVLFQEYIPGPASNHYFIDGFVDSKGRVCAMLARRRLRMFPIDFGNSSYMVTVSLDDVSGAVNSLERLLKAIGYRGIFSAEFKFDDRDSRFKILEINARPWWFIEFAAVCGVDVCEMAYRDALGMKVHPVSSYKIGSTLVHPYFDLNICRRLLRNRELTIPSWAKSWIGARYPVLCADDPMPAFAWWTKKAWYKITSRN